MKKDTFILHTDKREAWLSLSDEDAGKLIKACFDYHAGEAPSPPVGAGAGMFFFLKDQFDYDAESYARRVKSNSENGKKGGRPKTQENPKETQENPKKPYLISDPESDPESDPVSDPESDSDTDSVFDSDTHTNTKTEIQSQVMPKKNLLAFGEGTGTVYLTKSEFARLCKQYSKEAVYGMIRIRSADKQKAAQKNSARQKEPQSDFRQLNGEVADRYAKQHEEPSSYDREEVEAYWNDF